jgi:hypothetical protein
VAPEQDEGHRRDGERGGEERQDEGLLADETTPLIGSVATRPSEPSLDWPAIDDAPYPMVNSRIMSGRKFA